jgi:hypothetical protein
MGFFDTENIWDQEEASPEEMGFEDFNDQQEYSEEEEDVFEDIFDDTEDVQPQLSVMESARIRLEQGRLYEMLIKHNLFDGVDAIPEAVTKVEQELKEFIVERLEILLGMKAEKEKQIQHVVYDSQFNEMEIQALKMVASKITKGASLSSPSSEPKAVVKPVQEQRLNTIKKSTPTPTPKPSLGRPVQQKTKKPLPKKPSQPVVKAPKQSVIASGTLEDVAKKDMQYVEKLKEMSLQEANKIVSQRHKRPAPKTEINQDNINAHYANKMTMNDEASVFTKLLALAKQK